MRHPKISIIVPVYNTEAYLHRCVDSILAQTFTDFELILVNDGSCDQSGTICDEFANLNSKVRVIHQSNQGQAAVRNNAVAIAQGDWICFVDSDDLIHPQMLEILYNAVVNSDVSISMCGAVEAIDIPLDFFDTKEGVFSTYFINEESIIDLYNYGEHRYWVVWGKLIRKDIVERIPFTVGRIYEDNAVVCRWLFEAKNVANIQEALYFYAINPTGTTKSQFSIKKIDYLWALEEKIKFYRSVDYTQMQKRICETYLLTGANYFWMVKNELADKKASKRIRRRICRVYKKNKKIVSLTDNQRSYLYSVICPVRAVVKNGCRVLKQEGIMSFLRKVGKRLYRRLSK